MEKTFTRLLFLCMLLLFGRQGYAQLNYPTGGFSTFSSTYTDLGTTGTAVTMTNTDSGYSTTAQSIGFSFNYNGATYTSFNMYVDGFIKLGTVLASSDSNMNFSAYTQPPQGGPFNSTFAQDTSLIFPLGNNFWPCNTSSTSLGTGTADFRVSTTGTVGSRVCTIQWKNLSDKGIFINLQGTPTAILTQYDTINFQLKLYEGSNAIEFVYGRWVASANTSQARFAAVGLKGNNTNNTVVAQCLTITKGSTVAWSGGLPNSSSSGSPLGNYTVNAVNFGNNVGTARPAPDIGRVYHFGPLVNNDAAVIEVRSMGKIAIPAYLADPITARISNPGVNALSNLVVTLTVSGTNSYTTTSTISSLASGSATTVSFPAYTPTNTGVSLVTVSVPSDDNTTNNTYSYSMSVSNRNLGYTDTTRSFAGSNGSVVQIYACKYKINPPRIVTNIRFFVPANAAAVGVPVTGVLIDSTNTIVASSAAYTLLNSDMGAYVTLPIVTPVKTTATYFYAGISVGTSTFTASSFLNIYQSEGDAVSNLPRPEVSYIFPAGAGAAPTQQTNGRSMIECTVDPSVTNNIISASQNLLSGTTPAGLTGTAATGGIGTLSYLWLSSTTSATAGFTAAAGTNNTQNYTPAAITTTTWYKRVATATISDTSNAVVMAIRTSLNYLASGYSTFTSTYGDLGTTGTAVTMTNSDTGHSNAALPIGFTFTYNGADYTTFAQYVDGFLKLGNSYADTATSAGAQLITAYTGPPTGGIFNGTNLKDSSMIVPLGTDLWGGTSTPDFRYITTGSTGSRVCTIQWKNVKDKLQAGVATQYDTMNFQVKLYEGSNAIEFVYGRFVGSTNTSAAKFALNGLKGNYTTGSGAFNLLALTKGSTGTWATATAMPQNAGTPLGNYVGNAFNFGNQVGTSRPAPDNGRVYHFHPPVPNDITVRAVYSNGKIAKPYYVADSIRANIYNSGTAAQSNIVVTLNISGANTYTATANIASLAAGANTNVSFAPYTPATNGASLVSVSVPNDGNNLNNLGTYGLSVTNSFMSYNDSTQGLTTSYGSSIGSVWANRFKVNGMGQVSQVRSFIAGNSAATGDTVCGMVLSMTGSILGRSPNYIITAADLGTYLTFNITTPPVVNNTYFLAGIAQGNTVVPATNYFLGNVQNEIPTRLIDTTSYLVQNTAGISTAATGNVFGTPATFVNSGIPNVRLIMETTVDPVPPIVGNTISASQVICAGSTPVALSGSAATGGSGTVTYQWISSTTSATAGFAAAAGTSTGQGYTPGAMSTTTWFRRIATATISDTSAAVLITANQAVAGNTVTGAQTVCNGSTPVALTGSVATGGAQGVADDLNGVTTTAALTTANLPLGWAVTLNQNSLLHGANLNSYGRTGTAGALFADNYNVQTGTARVETKMFGSTIAGDSLRFDIAYASFPTSTTGQYVDTVRIFSDAGSGFVLLKQYLGSQSLDTTVNGMTTVAATSGQFSPTAAQWTRKALALPVGTNKVRFEFGTAYGNEAYVDNVIIDSTVYQWQVSTTSATAGFANVASAGAGVNYSPAAISQNTWYRRIATSGACAANTSAAVQLTVTNTNVWTGTTSTGWATGTNWGCARVPLATDSVVIATATNQPLIVDGGRLANSLTIVSGASLTLNNPLSALSIAGVLTNNGTFTQSAGEIMFAGTVSQAVPAGTYNKINVNNAAGITLAGAVTLNDSLKLTSGNVTLGANNLVITGTSGVVSNASASRYVVTNGAGTLTIQNVGTGSRTAAVSFPVGNSAYNPVSVTNSGTADAFSVKAIDSVTLNYTGTTPTGTKLASNVVNRTWIINEAVAGGSNANVTLQWNAAEELSGFTRASSYVSRYNGTTWLSNTASAAAGTGPYTQTRAGITAFSPFGVGSNGTLPVELLTFTGKRVGHAAMLNWVTSSEVNNDHFIIERSADGSNFEVVGDIIKGKGNSDVKTEYVKFDDNAQSFAKSSHVAVVYYRLSQYDFDGRQTLLNTVNVNFESDPGTLTATVQPNPFTTDLTIKLQSAQDAQTSIKAVDISGRVLFEKRIHALQGENMMPLSELNGMATGMYFIIVEQGEQVLSYKVVKTN